jgi:hypothetical protein
MDYGKINSWLKNPFLDPSSLVDSQPTLLCTFPPTIELFLFIIMPYMPYMIGP